MDDILLISSSRIIQWMNVIRDAPAEIEYRLLESFWDSQLRSKSWLVNNIKKYIPELSGNVYIMGGWYGILSQLIVDNFRTSVYNIDLDTSCIKYGGLLSNHDYRIKFLTRDMAKFGNYVNPQLIINTSTEHVTQETYNLWLEKAPSEVPIVIQGNNFYECFDHIRCFDTLEEFNTNNLLKNIVYTGTLECMGPNKPFHRFMTIGYK
jgi:hypothetical protein